MNNEVIQGDGFYISYVPNTLPFLLDRGGEEETALVEEGCKECRGEHFYILNGDFRKDYEPLVKKGFKECLEFYESKKPEFDSFWTTYHIMDNTTLNKLYE